MPFPPAAKPSADYATAHGVDTRAALFLGGNRLPDHWQGKPRFVVLEIGFDRGLNFLLTWRAWKNDPERCRHLHFLVAENHPPQGHDLLAPSDAPGDLAPLAEQLRAVWPERTPGFHHLEFEQGAVTLTLGFGGLLACVGQFVAEPDAIVLNASALADTPAPALTQLLKEIALSAQANATWTTDDARLHEHFPPPAAPGGAPSIFSQVMTEGNPRGMTEENPPGIAEGKAFADSRPDRPATPPTTPPAPQYDSIVVGAGLAGCTLAEALARQGHRVGLFERHANPAEETSGNKTAVMLPMLSLDDNRTSRLNRACYLHALRSIAHWRSEGLSIDGAVCGVLQIGRDAAHVDKQREILARCGFPESYVRFVEISEASQLAGFPVAGPGWWFAGGAWWNPPALCRAALTRAADRLDAHWSAPIERIEETDGLWSVFDATDRCLGRTRHLVLASAHDLLRLPQTAHLPLFKFRGQVTHLAAPNPAPLRCVVCKEGYVSPAWQGLHCVGASFHRGGEAALRTSDHAANLHRLQSMLPGYGDLLPDCDPARVDGRVGFRPVSPDKLPIVGAMYRPEATPQGRDLSAVERWPGLYVASGYGARGLVWSLLMAELLACQIAGAPLPLESDLAATVDPARFLLRRKD